MKVEKYHVGPLSTNCYLVASEGEGVIIDPGEEGDFLSEEILRHKLSLKFILLTHGHFDHVLGILPLKLNFNCPIVLSNKDLFLYQKAASSSKYWVGEGADPLPSPDKFYQKGEGFNIANTALDVLETPGHTPGSVVLYNKSEKIIFTGDLLFKDGVGRTDFSYSSKSKLNSSLSFVKKKFRGFLAYSGHGEEFYI